MGLRVVAGLALLLAGCAALSTQFPPSPTPRSVFHSLYKPDGPGPFPAVVLLHTCAGLRPHVLRWAEHMKDRGYLALVVDSFTPRGVSYNCGTFHVSVDQVNDDAFGALAHLRSRPDVIPERVGVMGYSYGAMAALRLASARYHGRERRFGAVVSVYPVCVNPRPDYSAATQERLSNLYDDVDTPTLVLIGDADNEVPGAGTSCDTAVRRLQAAGKPISIKLYPGVQHGFDQPGPRYSETATTDAKVVSVEFLNRQLPAASR